MKNELILHVYCHLKPTDECKLNIFDKPSQILHGKYVRAST